MLRGPMLHYKPIYSVVSDKLVQVKVHVLSELFFLRVTLTYIGKRVNFSQEKSRVV